MKSPESHPVDEPSGSKPKAGKKAKPNKAEKAGKTAVVLLSGGNPQIAKADGDAPVQAYIAAMPGWKSDLGKRLDALIVRSVPGVRKAVKWNSPFYGIEGQGWFLSFHVLHPLRQGDLLPWHLADDQSRPAARRRARTRAGSTSTKATASTKRRWPPG